jgi:hypothetical protein
MWEWRQTQLNFSALKATIWSQFGAAIRMLENDIVDCPRDVWEARRGTRPFWYLAYHTLYFYISQIPPIGFRPPPRFALSGHAAMEKIPDTGYSRSQLKEYLEHGRIKCTEALGALSEERALQRCGFEWVDVSV